MKKITQAVILAGGMGVRLRPFTNDRPKIMVDVAGRPFAEYLLDELKRNGIEKVVFLLGYLPEKIQEHFGDGSAFGLKITYLVTPLEDSTGTRVRKAKELLDDYFLLMYCDNYLSLDLPAITAVHFEKNPLLTMTVYTNKHGITKNNLIVGADGYIEKYDKKREAPGLSGVDMGFFIADKKLLEQMPEGDFWLYDLFPKLIADKQLAGYKTDELYYSVGSLARLEQTRAFFSSRDKQEKN